MLPRRVPVAKEHRLNAATYSDEYYFVQEPGKVSETGGEDRGAQRQGAGFSLRTSRLFSAQGPVGRDPKAIEELEPAAREQFGGGERLPFRAVLLEILPPKVDKASALKSCCPFWDRRAGF